ncbi:MAG: transposase, partial [Spirochaetes bacterium]|nr:transposase [Spirochaetota bacterium]
MARIPRIVIPGYPHHIVQRGNRRQIVFFSDRDKNAYIQCLLESTVRFGIDIWAYCLMDNHVHLIAVPKHIDSLARGMGEAQRKYTRMIHFREGWRGYLWQGRFLSYPLDRMHLYAAVRYVEQNPVRAGLVTRAEEYPWSSAKAHVNKKKDLLLSDTVLIEEIDDWESYLATYDEVEIIEQIQKHASTGRPLGNEQFITELERLSGQT